MKEAQIKPDARLCSLLIQAFAISGQKEGITFLNTNQI